jgi:hypothetical protein
MLNSEEKERLEELRNKDALTEEEKKEIATLEAKEPADPDQDEFDKAWAEDDPNSSADTDFDDDTDDDDQDDADDGGDDDDQVDDDDDQDSDSIFNDTPDDESDSQDNTDDDEEDTPEAKIAKLEAENAKLMQKMSSWEGRIRAANKKADEAEQKLKQAKGKGQGDSDEDASPDGNDDPELSEFFDEFPDLEKPIKKVAEKIAGKIIDDKLGTVTQSMQTVQDTLAEDASQKHITAINKAHPDWKQIYESGALESWIKRQPSFLQPRLYDIIESGSAEEVVEMFDSYKKAAGKRKSSINQSSSSSSKRKKKAQAMEAVPASSAGPRKPKGKPKKDDFDGAWNFFTKEDNKR